MPPDLRRRFRCRRFTFMFIGLFLISVDGAFSQTTTRIVPPLNTGEAQAHQSPFNCQPCHPRQFRENRQSVKSGYRNFSPTFNALELATNFLVTPALESGAILTNLRPTNVFHDPVSNLVTSSNMANNNNVRAGFCIGCHNGVGIGQSLNSGPDVARSEIPRWDGRLVQNPDGPEGQTFVSGDNIRPLRDYHFVDHLGNQVTPVTPGGPPPAGASTSDLGYGVNCDFCHNVVEPAMERSIQGDGFGNNSVQLLLSAFKVGSFVGAFPPRGNFHQSTNIRSRINYLRSPLLCNGCHDVRVPSGDIVVPEDPSHAPNIRHFRLENLSTEWAIGPYNIPAANPFNQVVRCQDCHMSLYPYAGDSTYNVFDPATGEQIEVTSPTPAVFPVNFAAEGVRGIENGDFGTSGNIPLPRRRVATHYFTGIDVPLLYDDELRTFLGDEYAVSPFAEGEDEYGIPLALKTRRQDLAEAAVRMDLDRTDAEATLGETFMARVRLIALTGHHLPAGFSQERGVWVQLTVSAALKDSDEDFVLYQSGYLVDKPHPETEELEPDGLFDDEDPEHLEAIVNPFTHDNEVFGFGPDDGPHARIFEGLKHGLVFLRNELVRIYGPAEFHGRETGIAGNSRLHPRTGEPVNFILEEETFSAGLSGFVDNWRALPPLYPRTYGYEIELPDAEELAEYGIELEGPLKVKAAVHFRHFPPLFLRFLARVSGAYVERNLTGLPRFEIFKGLQGPANRNLNLWSEQRLDDLVRIMKNIATAEITVPLNQGLREPRNDWKRIRSGGAE